MKKLLILESAEEAILFKKHPFEIDKILCINPSAEAELAGSHYKIISTISLYGDGLHKQSVEQAELAIQEVERYLTKNGHDKDVITRINTLLFYLVPSASFYYNVIQGADEYFWHEEGILKNTNSHLLAFKAIYNKSLQRTSAYRDLRKVSSVQKLLIKAYNYYIRMRVVNRKVALVVDGGRPATMNFIKEAKIIAPEIIVLMTKFAPPNIIKTLRQIVCPKKEVSLFYFPEGNSKSVEFNPKEISQNDFRQLVFEVLAEFITKTILVSYQLINSGKNIANKLKPEIIVTDSISAPFVVSLCQEVKEVGDKVVMFNHTSHTLQKEEIAKKITNLWASHGIISHPYATHNAIRMPQIAELAGSKEIIFPLLHTKRIIKTEHKKFNIVFAGNFFPIKDHVPFVAETPAEFAATILSLSKAVSQIPDSQLTIKLKADKPECNQAALEKLMPKYENVTLKSSGSFKEELAECDLVVSCLSATIDEALESWTPVLLYSSNYRYFHLEGMSEAPTPQKRGAVYTPQKSDDLASFITAIIASHKNKPLTKAEIAPYIWGEGADDMKIFAKKVLNN